MKTLKINGAFTMGLLTSLMLPALQSGAQQLQTPSGLGGIGTSPSSHIIATGSAPVGGIFKVQNTNGLANDKYWIGFSHGTNPGHTTDNFDRARIGVDILGGGAGSMFFTTGPQHAQAERMRIDQVGNVGINKTSPTFRLHVDGSVGFENLAFTSAANYGGILTRTIGNEVRVGILRDNGSTISLGNYFSPPANYMMHLYENSFSGGSHTIGIDIELFDRALAGVSKGFVCNIQGSQDNMGVDIYTAGGTTTNGGNFVANNASSTNTGVTATGQGAGSTTNTGVMAMGQGTGTTANTGVSGTGIGGASATGGAFSANSSNTNTGITAVGTGGNDATGGSFDANGAAADNIAVNGSASDGTDATAGRFYAQDATSKNIGVDAKALGNAANNYGGRFETENATTHNYGVYATAEFGPNSTGGFLTAAYTPNAKGIIASGIGDLTTNSVAKGGELAASEAKTSVGLMATGTGSSVNTHNYGIQATADAFSHGGGTTVNYGIYSSAIGGADVGTNAGVYVKADALGNSTINYGVYSKITGGMPANNPPSGAGSYAGYFYSGFSPTVNSVGAAFFNGVIIATTPGVTSVSDKKFKEDIHDLEGTMEKIMMLEPKSYLFKDEKEFPSFSFPQGTQFGFIAQDLEKIFPELVEESVNPAQYDDDGKMIADKVTFKGVEYTSLIPVLTAGIQEQQKMIEEKDARINELEERIARLEEMMNNNGTDIDNSGNDKRVSEAILFQNTPNPFNGNTEIRYRLPENYTHADVMIFDMNGKKIRSIALQGSEGYVTVSAHDLAAGMYMYSLVLDGEIAATKRMLVNK